jgi:hypothetical protein
VHDPERRARHVVALLVGVPERQGQIAESHVASLEKPHHVVEAALASVRGLPGRAELVVHLGREPLDALARRRRESRRNVSAARQLDVDADGASLLDLAGRDLRRE